MMSRIGSSSYRQMKVPVTVFVGTKTTDDTASIAARYAGDVISFVNPATRLTNGMTNETFCDCFDVIACAAAPMYSG